MLTLTQSPGRRAVALPTSRPCLWACAAGLVLCAGELAAQQLPALPPPLRGPAGGQLDLSDRLPSSITAMPTVNAKLEVIQRRSQLLIARGGITRIAIADPSVVDTVQYSPTELSVIGLALGTTTLTMWFEDDPDPLIYLVKVIRDPDVDEQRRIDYGKLERRLAMLFPNSKVYLIPVSNKIIVRGQARDSEEAAYILQIIRGEVINQYGSMLGPQPNNGRGGADIVDGAIQGNGNNWGFNDLYSGFIINQLYVPGEFQVMLRVRIVELNRSQLRRLGVNLAVLFDDGAQFLASSLITGTPTLTGIFENGDVTVAVDALKSNGVAKLLAEPTLTVLSGRDARFLSGGEFAVPTIVGINGVGGQQTVFRGVGTSLIVTPSVIDKDLVRMRIRPEFSEVNQQNNSGGVLGTNTRNLDTTVELREGQTIVLGGLISHRMRTEITGIPLLSGIPVVGPAIFQSKRSTEDETELLITVTPELVRPMEADEVPPYPGFEVTSPDDHLLYLKAFTQGPNDTSVNQLAPYGHGSGAAIPIGYGQFNPTPNQPGYAPVPTAPFAPAYQGANGGTQFYGGYLPPQHYNPQPVNGNGSGRYGNAQGRGPAPAANGSAYPAPGYPAAPAYPSAPSYPAAPAGPSYPSYPAPNSGPLPSPTGARTAPGRQSAANTRGGARSMNSMLAPRSGAQHAGYEQPAPPAQNQAPAAPAKSGFWGLGRNSAGR